MVILIEGSKRYLEVVSGLCYLSFVSSKDLFVIVLILYRKKL